MIFKSYASSSKGNLYSLSNGKDTILIECGVPIKRIRKSLDFGLSNIAGCISSHGHQDHIKGADGLIKAGVDLYITAGTYAESIGKGKSGQSMHHRINIIKPMHKFSVGSFNVMPFPTIHDAVEPCSFIIASGKDKCLFITDSAYIPYKFTGVTILAIESNYQEDILKRNIDSGKIPVSLKNRLLFSHFSLDNVVRFIKDNDNSKLKEVHLIHLSAGNSDAANMQRTIAGITGVPVYVAKE